LGIVIFWILLYSFSFLFFSFLQAALHKPCHSTSKQEDMTYCPWSA